MFSERNSWSLDQKLSEKMKTEEEEEEGKEEEEEEEGKEEEINHK